MTTEDRLEKLERELNRAKHRIRWLLAGLGFCFGIAVVVGMAASALAAGSGSKEIRSSHFILEDANGKSRAELAMTEDGPALRLKDVNGKDRALLYVHGKAALTINDDNGKARLVLGVVQNTPVLFLYDEKDEARAMLAVNKDGPFLGFYDEKRQRLPIR